MNPVPQMVVDTLFICVCEDRNINGGEGRWKDSRLAELGGGGGYGEERKRNAELEEGTEIQNLQTDKYWVSLNIFL